jgi:hypothetical protein
MRDIHTFPTYYSVAFLNLQARHRPLQGKKAAPNLLCNIAAHNSKIRANKKVQKTQVYKPVD